jgi:ubiquinone biosynthesis protein
VGIAVAARVAGRNAAGVYRRIARLRRCVSAGQITTSAEPGHAVAFFTVVLGVPLIVAMIVIVGAEVLVPTGTGPGPLEDIRGVRSAMARFRRYWQISRIAARHGLGPYLRGRRRGEDAARGQAALALSLRRALEEGGVTFTKLGQLLSTRRDLLPEEFISELSRLQDRAEQAPWEQVEEVITQSLGAPGQDSPLPCGKNSTSGWRPATRRPWPLRGQVSSGPSGAALR